MPIALENAREHDCGDFSGQCALKINVMPRLSIPTVTNSGIQVQEVPPFTKENPSICQPGYRPAVPSHLYRCTSKSCLCTYVLRMCIYVCMLYTIIYFSQQYSMLWSDNFVFCNPYSSVLANIYLL